MPSPKISQRTAQALQQVAGLLESKGWKILAGEPGSAGPDLVVRRRGQRYGVVLKATSEGRADRVIPLLSQAVLEARAYALQSHGFMPMAVVHVDGVMVADVIQVWLDVLNHPTRGQEQAEHIFRKVLRPLG